MLLYDMLITSQLNYCNNVWASTYKTSLTKICSLQKRALRICIYRYFHSPYFTPYPVSQPSSSVSPFSLCNKLTVLDTNKLQVACFVYRILNNQAPACFSSFLKVI